MAKMAKGEAIAESPNSTTTSKISKGQHKARHNKKTAGDHKGEKPARRANAKASVAAASISDSNTEGSIEINQPIIDPALLTESAAQSSIPVPSASAIELSAPITHDADRIPEVESNAVVIPSPEVESSVVSAAPTIVKTQAEETTQIDVSAPVPASSSLNISALAGAACPVVCRVHNHKANMASRRGESKLTIVQPKPFISKRHDPAAKARARQMDAEEHNLQYAWLDRPQPHHRVQENKTQSLNVRRRERPRSKTVASIGHHESVSRLTSSTCTLSGS
ncbi:hypothetical protein LTR97_000953 [Elasticomyces elasticus]|uniref:Uncharacterized protein n=1 Tax=Elasticomyces elasticus TaxID=574655 RepID=A0AAN7WDH2_9PEZI|nr:hypothetical protein LTR97_000953 [Elasticomyces elasticus]